MSTVDSNTNNFSWREFLRLNCDEKTIQTLTSFVRDNEHEVFAVVTALQAQIDLLRSEQMHDNVSEKRFASLDRSVARLVSDTNILSSVSEMAKSSSTNRRVMLEELMQEVVAETQPDFLANHVGLSCTIAKNSSLPGYAAPLKLMFKAMLLAVLCTCKNLDKVKIVAALKKNLVSINFDTGLKSEAKEFKHWPLGKLHSVPFNTEGIGLAAIDAMARFHQGHLSVCHHKNQHDEYMLSFKK